jgi:hypothetical protein
VLFVQSWVMLPDASSGQSTACCLAGMQQPRGAEISVVAENGEVQGGIRGLTEEEGGEVDVRGSDVATNDRWRLIGRWLVVVRSPQSPSPPAPFIETGAHTGKPQRPNFH